MATMFIKMYCKYPDCLRDATYVDLNNETNKLCRKHKREAERIIWREIAIREAERFKSKTP